jgi:hypothetical protein
MMMKMNQTVATCRRRGAVRKRRKGIYILPNLFTLAALFGGFYAIVMAMNGRFDLAAVGVFAPWCSTVWMVAWPA